MTEETKISPAWIWIRSLLSFVCFSCVGIIGLEIYVDRFAWLVSPSWYRLDTDEQSVRFSCQRFRPVTFTPKPAPNTKRILMVGGSTTFGFPHRPAGSDPIDKNIYGFVGVLSETLNTYFPKQFEVINLGINGGGTIDTLKLLRKEKLWGAHTVIVYDGHNEFLPVPKNFTPFLWRFALYRHLSVLFPKPVASSGWVAPSAHGSKQHHDAILNLFRHNLQQIIHLSRQNNAKPFLVTQASNLTGIDPNWSTNGDAQELRNLSSLGDEELFQKSYKTTKTADLAWRVATRKRERREWDVDAYQAALDNDGLQLRAGTAINDAIKSVAAKESVSVIDAEAFLRPIHKTSTSPLFFDWVHPTPAGSKWIAKAVLETLQEEEVVPKIEGNLVQTLPPTSEQTDGYLRIGQLWLQYSCVRNHDPLHRLQQAKQFAQMVLLQDQENNTAQTLLQIIDEWENPPIEIHEKQRPMFQSLHPCIADKLSPPKIDTP
ncbi:MAG: SGNH/GDSL hydrolase family protein [Myxococcota bacterium]|nr:SGNH/GDSL hydrolase family protein [Myxococcota bacterium]